MTKNKKKLRRAEKLYSVTRTAQTLVLTGLLLAGGVTGAMAATPIDTQLGRGNTVTTSTSDDTINLGNQPSDKFAKNVVVTNGGGLTITATNYGELRLDQVAGAGLTVANGGTLTMNNGAAILGIQNASPWGYYGTGDIAGDTKLTDGSSISLDSIDITGGTHTINGTLKGGVTPHPKGGEWRDGSQIYAGHDLTITNSTVALGDNGLIGAGARTSAAGQHLTIGAGGVVNMTGTDAGKASVMHVFDKAVLNVKAGGKINVTSTGYGAIGSGTTTVDGAGSSITVAAGAHLEMIDKLPEYDTKRLPATEIVNAGLTFTSGNLNLTNGGRVYADNADFKAGTLTIDGTNGIGGRSGIYGIANDGTTGEFIFGADATSKLTVNVTGGGGIEGKEITINGGTITIEGKGALNSPSDLKEWRKGSIVYADETLDINGGTITVGDYGILGAGQSNNSAITIDGGTVTLAGSQNAAALLRAASDKATLATHTPLSIGAGSGNTDATVQVKKGNYGVIVAGTTEVKANGKLLVHDGGSLLMRGDDYTVNTIGTGAAGLTVKDTHLNINGGLVDVTGDMRIESTAGKLGLVTVATGNLKVDGNLDFTTGRLDMTGGTARISGMVTDTTVGAFDTSASNTTGTLFMGAFTGAATGGSLTVNNGAKIGFYGTGVDNKFYNGDSITLSNAGAELILGGDATFEAKGGKFDGQTTVSGGTLAVKAGNWTLDKLDVQANGSAMISGGILTIGSEIKSAEVGNGSTDGINMSGTGVLQAKFSDVVNDAKTDFKNTGDQHSFSAGAGSTLWLTGGSGAMTLAEMKALNEKLLGNNTAGTVKLDGITVTGLDNTTKLSEVADAHASVENAVVKADTITTGSATVGGLHDASTGLTVGSTGTSSLTLTGQGNTGGELAQGATSSTNYTLSNGSSLTLGNAASNTASGGTLTGNVIMSVSNGGNLNAVNGDFTVSGNVTGNTGSDTVNVKQGGTLSTNTIDFSTTGGTDAIDVAGGNLNVGTIKTGGNTTTISVADGTIQVDNIIAADSKTKINVGNNGNAGTLVANSVELNGATLFLDPSWIDGQLYQDAGTASRAAIKEFTGGKVDGLVMVGENSQLSLGTANVDQLTAAIRDMGNVWGSSGITAALGIYSPQTLDTTGAIEVDGSRTSTTATAPIGAKNATFADKSLLVVSAAGIGSGLALKGDSSGALTVKQGAKLHILGGKSGETIHITDGFGASTADAAAWTGANLTSDTALLNAVGGTFNTTNGKYDITLTANAAASVFPLLSNSMGGLVDTIVRDHGLNTESANMGIKFISRAASDSYIGRNNATQAAATIEGAAQLATVGAVPAMTLSAVQAGTSAVTTRTSFASPLFDSTKAVAMHRDTDGTLSIDSGLNAGSSMKNGLGLWIMPLYQSNSAWGMEAENFDSGYKSDLGGVALGVDYTVNDMFRFGLAFNIGGGYAESTGDFSKTDNSFSFWGINAYGGWSMNNFGITADVGYTGNYNKVKQELPGSMAMDDIKSDVTSSAWTAGLRGEYKFATEALDIIPHVGVRYTGLTTDEYKAKSGGDTVFKVDQDFQNIWTFPIGVTFAKEIETSSGWIVRPQVDLGITPATGDVKAKSKVRIPGVDAQAEMKMQVVDYMSYDGGVGLEMKKDNISFGINYNIQASEHRTGHGVFGTLRYEF